MMAGGLIWICNLLMLSNAGLTWVVEGNQGLNIFDYYYKKYDAWYDRNKFTYLSELQAVKKVLPKKAKGLEIGVGTGRFAVPLGITTGIDSSKNMIKIAKERGIDARLGFGERLPFKSNSFDYVAIIITLCFVKDPLMVLKQARRVLRENGHIIIGIIDKGSLLGKFYQKKKSVFYKQANFFRVQEVEDLLRAAGFSRLSYYQALFELPGKTSSVDKPRKGFGRGSFVVISARKVKQAKSEVSRKFNQYEKIRFLFKRYGYDMEDTRIQVFKRAGKLTEPVLDVGTGPGRMAYTIARGGNKVTTIDISQKAQKVAAIYAKRYKVSGRIKFINMDAQDMKFMDDSFAAVISVNLLHDVNNPRRVIQEMIRVVKPSGKIIISDLNNKGARLVSKVYRVNSEVHRGKPIDLEKVVGGTFEKAGISFNRYKDGYITTYVGRNCP